MKSMGTSPWVLMATPQDQMAEQQMLLAQAPTNQKIPVNPGTPQANAVAKGFTDYFKTPPPKVKKIAPPVQEYEGFAKTITKKVREMKDGK